MSLRVYGRRFLFRFCDFPCKPDIHLLMKKEMWISSWYFQELVLLNVLLGVEMKFYTGILLVGVINDIKLVCFA